MILRIVERESIGQHMLFFVAMNTSPKCSDPRLKRAAEFYAQVPDMKLHEAMRSVGFSNEEINSPSVQMKVRRRPEFKRKKDKSPVEIVDASVSSSVSGLSSSSSSSTTSKMRSKSAYRAKTTRLLPHQVQTKNNNARLMNQRRKEAHKAATNMYDQERKKRRTDPTRLSAAAVGNQDRRGGRPSVSFFDPNIPQAGHARIPAILCK